MALRKKLTTMGPDVRVDHAHVVGQHRREVAGLVRHLHAGEEVRQPPGAGLLRAHHPQQFLGSRLRRQRALLDRLDHAAGGARRQLAQPVGVSPLVLPLRSSAGVSALYLAKSSPVVCVSFMPSA